MSKNQSKAGMDRRSFLRSTAAAGAGLFVSPMILGQSVSRAAGTDAEPINVALLGAGAEGQVLMTACLNMNDTPGAPRVRFKAVCDIWTQYNQRLVSRRLTGFGHEHNDYVDYEEMLDKEKDNLDAVIIATPDFWHADHAVACLEAGLDVYCEKEMSNTLEGAKRIVEAANSTGRLLQIGHQRRSNPFYKHAYNKLIKEANLLGQLTTINGQWNRSKSACEDIVVADAYKLDDASLEKYGFGDMQRFLNWRWYKGLGGGPIVDLGSHQIDIYTWFVGSNPKSVIASGGQDYWPDRDWYDSVMTIFEYEQAKGNVRAFYQTITTNSGQGYFENFMGDEGTLIISESSARNMTYREAWVDEAKWQPWVDKGYIKATTDEEEEVEEVDDSAVEIDPRQSLTPPSYAFPDTVTMDGKPAHQPHLENFFSAVLGKEELNCPAEIGYETAVTVLKVNEAIEAGRKLEFTEDEFTV